jgi:hypothetical protein
MKFVNWHVREQLAATNALVHFLETHGGYGIDEPLFACRDALERGDAKTALKYAHGVKPFGTGSITDSYPTASNDSETSEYLRVVQGALARNWMFWMSTADHSHYPFARDLIRSVGKFFRS